MSQHPSLQNLFERPLTLPDPDARTRLARLVGMDDKIKRLANVLGVLINPAGLRKWQSKHHAGAEDLLDTVLRRPPAGGPMRRCWLWKNRIGGNNR